MKKFHPQSPDPFIQKAGDQELARFGHLNALIDQLPQTLGVTSVVAGTNVTVDNTDPLNPIINATGGGGNLQATLTAGDDAGGLNITNLTSLQVATFTELVGGAGITVVGAGLNVDKINSIGLVIGIGVGAIKVISTTYSSGLVRADDTGVAAIGDADADVNGTSITVNDLSEETTFTQTHLKFGLTAFVDNAAALTGTLVAGDYYVNSVTNIVTRVV